MEVKNVWEKRLETAIKDLAPLTANGANGEAVVQTVVMESKQELLKLKLNTVDKNAKEKLKETAMKDPVWKEFP